MHILKIPLLIVAVIGGLLACDGTKPAVQSDRFGGPTPADSLFFSMERTPCFGRCPAYTLNVYRSGYATFFGRSNTPLQGAHMARVDQDRMERLLAEAEGVGFFAFEATYDGKVTDLPSTIVRVVSGDRDKKVVGRYRIPDGFRTLAQTADSLLLPLPWKRAEGSQ